jgi:hypothetical protein
MRTEKCYGVLIGLKNGQNPWLATDGKGVPAIFNQKKQALRFRDKLAAPPNRIKGKVLRVNVSYEIPKLPTQARKVTRLCYYATVSGNVEANLER